MPGIPQESQPASTPPRGGTSIWPVLAGAGVTVGVGIGVWLGIGAIFSALAGPDTGEATPYWRDLVYGSGTIGSTFLLTRRGIASIPQTLHELRLPGAGGSVSALSIVLLILQLLAGLFLFPAIRP